MLLTNITDTVFSNVKNASRISVLMCVTLFSFSVYGVDDLGKETSAFAKPEITNLDELLTAVRQQQRAERDIERQRERDFLRDKNRQKSLLNSARRNFEIAQKHNNPLQKITELNQLEIKKLQDQLQQRTQEMGDIYSIFNEFSGDFSAVFNASMTAIEFPERQEKIDTLLQEDTLATIADMQDMWLLLQQDMTATSKVQVLTVPVVQTNGISQLDSVVRVGAFTVFSGSEFLRYIPEVNELLALERQPSSRYLAAIKSFDPQADVQLVTIDPTGGNLLGMMSYSPSVLERIEQAGMIGKIIIGLGAIGVLLTLWRVLYLLTIYFSIKSQQNRPQQANKNNPLGRVMLHAQQDVTTSALAQGQQGAVDALQFKLDEAVLLEVPNLERGHNFIKLLAAVSPLLGLLGTVTGMIVTFQAISLFGSGDPKLMASGISQALMTTVLGLVVAIPLLFGHSFVAALARTMIQRLDEQTAGIMAEFVSLSQRKE